MKEEKFDFAYRDGKIVTIEEVNSGLECNCICPNCNSKLIAKKGKIKKHHFAHYEKNECEGYGESLLHIAAKEILKNSNYIFLPEYDIKTGIYENLNKYYYNNAVLEQKKSEIIPDVILNFGDNREIFVEITFTHGVDNEKISKIKSLEVSTLEIDINEILKELYRVDKLINYECLKKIILEENTGKKWVYDRKEKEKKRQHLMYLESLERKKLEKKEKEKIERFRLYKTQNIIGVIYKSNRRDAFGGNVFLEEMEHGISLWNFKRNYGEKTPKYKIAIGENIYSSEYINGAIWENNNKLSGLIEFNNNKYRVYIEQDCKQLYKYYIKKS